MPRALRRPCALRPPHALVALGLWLAAPAWAGHGGDQDFARAATQTGEAMPFARVQQRLATLCECRVLEARLKHEKDDGLRFLIYDIKALQPDGVIVKLQMHAATGEILKYKHKGRD
ncbi:MAG: hypothetical protein REI09_00990 [Candidatus Dactylopiibacterium sp.]|nr:hypothetical protein [Candidatus Dactylopiibacterium sp.]